MSEEKQSNPEAEEQQDSQEHFSDLDEKPVSLLREFVQFLGENKKYWLLPIILVLFLLGLLIMLGGSSAAPFIYTLF